MMAIMEILIPSSFTLLRSKHVEPLGWCRLVHPMGLWDRTEQGFMGIHISGGGRNVEPLSIPSPDPYTWRRRVW